jgi:hypothetical protein
MKYIFTFALFIFSAYATFAQTATIDSISLSFNNKYYLVNDSCADITRHGHLNMKTKRYIGPFKDISTEDSVTIVTEGNYDNAGLKDGLFTLKYLNGNLQAKGTFKNDKYEGKWELYYVDGKPELTFEAENNFIKIIDAWDTDGKKIVDNGSGEFRINNGDYYWEGKIAKGRPDGTWNLSTINPKVKLPSTSEYFKKNVFKNGTNASGDYSDSSRIILISTEMLPFLNAENLITDNGCTAPRESRYVVKAQYRTGWDAFRRDVAHIAGPIIRRFGGTSIFIGQSFTITGDIDEKGEVINLRCDDMFNPNLTRSIIDRLSELANFQPATINEKPVKEKFTLTFSFEAEHYRFHYKFLKVEKQQ